MMAGGFFNIPPSKIEPQLFCTLINRKGSFPVPYNSDQTIYHLKVAIKPIKSDLNDFDADEIKLYRVDLDESKEEDRMRLFEAITKGIDPPPTLHGSFRPSYYFPGGPTADRVQVIVSPRESRDPRSCGRSVMLFVLARH